MTPQQAALLVGHSSPQPEAGERVALKWLEHLEATGYAPEAAFAPYARTIKRLLADLKHDIERHIDICAELATENERMRTALRAVRNFTAHTDKDWAAGCIQRAIKDALREQP